MQVMPPSLQTSAPPEMPPEMPCAVRPNKHAAAKPCMPGAAPVHARCSTPRPRISHLYVMICGYRATDLTSWWAGTPWSSSHCRPWASCAALYIAAERKEAPSGQLGRPGSGAHPDAPQTHTCGASKCPTSTVNLDLPMLANLCTKPATIFLLNASSSCSHSSRSCRQWAAGHAHSHTSVSVLAVAQQAPANRAFLKWGSHTPQPGRQGRAKGITSMRNSGHSVLGARA